ncbi:hypothetical protein ABVT39_003292 [Epinephelus coioides]
MLKPSVESLTIFRMKKQRSHKKTVADEEKTALQPSDKKKSIPGRRPSAPQESSSPATTNNTDEQDERDDVTPFCSLDDVTQSNSVDITDLKEKLFMARLNDNKTNDIWDTDSSLDSPFDCFGFLNNGHTCCMNASLQSLLTLEDFNGAISHMEQVWSSVPEAQLMSCGAQSVRQEGFTNLSLDLIPRGSVEEMLQEHLKDGGCYSVVSAISHFGSTERGHYISKGIHPDYNPDEPDDQWLTYNDSMVFETSGKLVCEQQERGAYILFYKRSKRTTLSHP